MGYLLTQASTSDLTKIFDYTCEKWGLIQAEEYLLELKEVFLKLALFPELGRVLNLNPRYRIFFINRHLVIYTTQDTEVIIVRVLHARLELNEVLSGL
jgi:toxin ParE1/3/4